MADHTIPMSTVIGGLTLNVRITGLRSFKLRLWLATRLMMLAAWITGCGIAVSLDD